MKTYKFIKTSTAGNRTGYIIGKTAYQNRKKIMAIIMKKKNLEAEQYAFLWKENQNSFINTAGGEICGGAILASSVILGNYSGQTRIFTRGRKLKTTVTNKSKNKIYVQTELSWNLILEKPKKVNFSGYQGWSVKLDGIAYFLTEEPIKNKFSLFKKLNQQLNFINFPAIGIIEVNENRIKPAVWVKLIKTKTEERGCTTGTISAQLAYPRKNGLWQQPSGEFIKAKIANDGIIIESGIETLSDGKLYLS